MNHGAGLPGRQPDNRVAIWHSGSKVLLRHPAGVDRVSKARSSASLPGSFRQRRPERDSTSRAAPVPGPRTQRR